jgi:hypothetical protein
MGCFSFITADTKKSIRLDKPFTVYLTAPDGRQWREDEYEGYGEFGGKDIFELVAELNGKITRSEGIDLLFENDTLGRFLPEKGLLLPTITETAKDPFRFGYPEDCPKQGCFEDEEDEDE